GIEWGAQMAMFFADEAIVVTNPEVSSVRDSDRILGLLDAKTQRATEGLDAIRTHLLLTRYSPKRVEKGEMLSYTDVVDLLRIPLVGVIPESPSVLQSSNSGTPVILEPASVAAQAYSDLVHRFTGADVPFRFLQPAKRSFFNRIFGGSEAAAYAG